MRHGICTHETFRFISHILKARLNLKTKKEENAPDKGFKAYLNEVNAFALRSMRRFHN